MDSPKFHLSMDFFLEMLNKQKYGFSIRNLHNDPQKKITVVKISDISVLLNIYNSVNSVRQLSLDFDSKCVFTYLASNTKPLINLFCCNFRIIEIYDKLSTHGLILEGCFNINPVTKKPNAHYIGKNLQGHNFIKGELPDDNLSYLIIDNHQHIKIMTGLELKTYKSIGINVQCMQGDRIMTNGLPQENMSNEKTGMIVIAKDYANNIIIIYHPKITTYDMISLLFFFKTKDAIVICKSDNSHIIWKEHGMNYYNKSDFIGNTNDYVSNSITISS